MKKKNKIFLLVFSFGFLIQVVLLGLFSNLLAQEWIELGANQKFTFNGAIKTSYTDKVGQLYIGGYFTNDSGNYFVAKWDGISWVELGGTNGLAANGCILSITGDDFGNLYVAGNFFNANRQNYVARWNGSKWSELGGTNSLSADWNIRSICTDKDGNLYAAGGFSNGFGKKNIAKWTKRTNKWSVIRNSNGNGMQASEPILSIIALSNGNLYAGGHFSDSTGKKYVCEWNDKEGAWLNLGGKKGLSANAWIEQVVCDSMGNIYVAGKFTNDPDSLKGYNYVAKWDGIAWKELEGINKLNANGAINTLFYDNSKHTLYVAGEFSDAEKNTKGNKYVAQWDGLSWSAFSAMKGLKANNTIETVCTNTFGEIFVAGWIKNTNNKYYVARYTSQTFPLNIIINFKVELQNNNEYQLSWQTTDETSIDNLCVEKSYNGIDFFVIERPKLKLSNINYYTYTDVSTPKDSSTVFYRLAVQNNSSKITYSKTISVSNFFNRLSVKILGNPIVGNYINMICHSPVPKTLHCSIIDINGKRLFQENLNLSKGSNHITLSPNFISSGVYFMKMEGQSSSIILNVVK